MSLCARLFLVSLAGLLVAATPREFTREELRTLEAERDAALRQLNAIEKAENSSIRDVANLESELIAAAMESRRREEQAAASELKLIDLSTRLESAREELVLSNTSLEDIMASLAISGRHHPPALIASPGEANDAIRAAIVMSATAPVLDERTDALAEEIARLKLLDSQIRREKARLETTEARLALKKAEIEQLVATKRAQFENVSGQADQLRARVDKIGAEAKTLRDLLVALESSAPGAPGMKPDRQIQLAANTSGTTVTDAPKAAYSTAAANLKPLGAESLGGLMRPVSGLVSKSWGESLPGGESSKGVYIQPRKEADVIAPADGKIEYAGMFRSYGQLLIISTSDGYHILLSGMARIYGTPGQTVKAGEPVGRMPNREIPPPELYLEVRKAGTPMNPARWMKGS
ncbi:murein hydrolase activator EnvC family protein [Henriciella aquimarina]|uniref:murein hydrolase activator EnvC family protein n=1 Tax=Henriciella aquimarina TaxID=545261 RepID=UPI000A0775EC|nr:peptidoglycan DD-metalloendopeptidase family protein [Henriciella aquimarina]